MEVDKLRKDELLFEIATRGDLPDKTATVEDMRIKLKALMAVEHEVDFEDVYSGPDDEELLFIGLKLDEASELLESLKDVTKGPKPNKTKSLLSHLTHRVRRLFGRLVGDQRNELKVLALRLKEYNELLISLGSGAGFKPSELGSFSSIKTKEHSRHSEKSRSRHESEGSQSGSEEERRGPRRRHKGGGQKLDFHKWNVSFSGADDKSVNSFI